MAEPEKPHWMAAMELASERADKTGKIIAVCRDAATELPAWLTEGGADTYEVIFSDAVDQGYCITAKPRKP